MEHTKVVIVGAGISGLAAANKLCHAGIPSIVLEARNRMGGRIHTDFSLGIPVSLGAQWMHGTEGNPLKEIADKLNLKYIDSGFGHVAIYDRKGNLIPFEKVVEFYESFNKRLAFIKKYARKQDNDVSVEQALQETEESNLKNQGLKNQSLKNQSIKDLTTAALMRLCLYNGADIKYLSGRHWDDETVLPGGNLLMLDGFEPIVKDLASSCHIQLNMPVTEIIRTDDRVIVKTPKKAWTADYVIITVPLGVLKNNKIHFDPELPAAKRNSIEKLDMGVLDSVVLKFPKVFWPTVQGMQFTKSDIAFPIFTNLHSFYKKPILTARLAGDQAKTLEKLDESKAIQKVMTDLKKIFGKDIPEPDNYLITRWSQDPFSFGSYSYLRVGCSGEDFDNLSTTVAKKLFFAGEATSRNHPGTVHGAYMSGLRAAESILLLNENKTNKRQK